MKLFLSLFFLLTSTAALAIERGINYDPAHSVVFTRAQAANNIDGMRSEITKDLNIIRQSGFNVIKTFYSSVSTIDGQKIVLLADLACPMNFKIMLGVYEFNPASDNCANWCEKATAIQVQNAIDSVNKYPDCISGIVVGNEDIYNWNFTEPNKAMQQRIANDIATIKQKLGNSGTPVGSAQQDGAWLKLANDDPYQIISKADFIGANIYPFWSPQQPDEQAAQQEFENRYQAVKNHNRFQDKKIIVTEEGWPSKSASGQNPNASIAAETSYYQWWQNRATTDAFDSYYFAIFDKQPTNLDADKYFGLCTDDRKNKILTQCEQTN
ncbi:glycoside hydrolase family 17 protein [Legionella spiritensis]|uniref:Endo-1,3-beta-glucanase btgC n=1 Tax=Legionella spiritensis TaxID=452 RepID=A0A0W0Z9F1_LEGSP|nr:hypothetical protein [Legionella spiritensis]KTD65744.1 hypothetical protein Lspi_0456 [Legionella spiritensis]SNV42768.1 Exo-beta-1,3-glucanase [Legionella spiritensis]